MSVTEHSRRVSIDPSRLQLGSIIPALWSYRELLYFLVWRDVKVRYRQTAFGAGWAVGQPLLMTVVFAIFLGRLVHVGSEGLPYPVFVYAALVPWTLLTQVLASASNSLVGNANLISKVYFPRLLLPLAAAASFVVDFVIALVVLVLMMLVYHATPSIAIIWLPFFALLTFACAVGLGMLFAAVNVRYRDVKYALPFVIQLWLFATPVAYSASLIPERWRLLFSLNPMAGAIEGFRWSVLGVGAPSPGAILTSVLLTTAILVGGALYFQSVERRFADII